MNKRLILFIVMVVLVASLAIAAIAVAAELKPAHVGSMCPSGGEGTWHFVNNQTGGAAAGLLSATFSTGSVVDVAPSQVNQKAQHFYVDHDGVLLSASTNLPGKLVLSDLDCGDPTPTPKPPTPTPTPKPPTPTPTPEKPTPTPVKTLPPKP